MVREYMNMDEVVAIMQCVQPQGCQTRNLLLKLYGSEILVTFTCCSTSLGATTLPTDAKTRCRTETALTYSRLAERLISLIGQATLFGFPTSQR